MVKTRFGISVGLLGALMYFSGIFNGYLLAVIIAGYILLAEDNIWLRKTAVRALTIMIICSLLIAMIGLVPDVLTMILSLLSVFKASFSISVVNSITSFLTQMISVAEKVLLIVFGIKAINQGTITIPVLDKFINKLFAEEQYG